MASATTETMIKMMENLPEGLQDRVLEHMREYVHNIREEIKWNESFSKSQNKLIAAARQARKEISEGKSLPFDSDMLRIQPPWSHFGMNTGNLIETLKLR